MTETDDIRRFDRRTVLGRIAGAVGALTGLVGGAAAQEETESPTPTDADTPTSTPAEDGSVGEEDVELDIAPTTTITSWEYAGGSWTLGLDTTTPTRLTITDASQVARVLSEGDGPSAGMARYEGYNLSSGESEFRFTGESYQGMAAITVSAAGGSRLAVLRTDALAGGRGDVAFQQAAGAAAAGSVVTGGAVVRQMRRKQNAEEKETERIL